MARGSQSKKLDDSSVPWTNVTPDDPTAILAGSSQGGFMCLEEVDGAFYSEFSSNTVEPLPAGDLGFADTRKSTKGKNKRSRKELDKLKPCDLSDETPICIGRVKKKTKQKHNATECKAESLIVERSNVVPESMWNDEFTDQKFRDERLLGWAELRLHGKIMLAISTLGYLQPTPIQKACIPAAAHQGKDIIGAAETGSGKTLAFVVPIIQRLLQEEEKYVAFKDDEDEGSPSNTFKCRGFLRALILAPTRELALQVCKHFKEAAKFTTIKAVPIVGGMASQKQERLLKRKPEVVVGTPGRLWELMSAGEQHLSELKYLSFFVLDEADRMIEKGHFQELQSILSLLPIVEGQKEKFLSSNESKSTSEGIHRRQTFVFSATLALPAGFRKQLKHWHHHGKAHSKKDEYSIAFLSERAGMRPNVAIFDLTTKNIVADKLEESIIQCGEEEKDLFLYYLLKLHGLGRTIIFCTSIAAVRHVTAVLGLLQVQAWPLHAQMQQRQRLKYMDRFQSKEDSCLISTDVAARGLDLPGVRTVIHYQLPHSAEKWQNGSSFTGWLQHPACHAS